MDNILVSDPFDVKTQSRLQFERLTNVMKSVILGNFIVLIGSIYISYLNYTLNNMESILIWNGLLIVTMAIRIFSANQFLKNTDANLNYYLKMEKRVSFFSFLNAFVWISGLTYFMQTSDLMNVMIWFVPTSLYSISSFCAYNQSPLILYPYNFVMCSGLLINCLKVPGDLGYFLAFTICAMFFSLAKISRDFRRMNNFYLKTKFDHEKLTKDFNKTKANLVASSQFTAVGEMANGLAHEINNPLHIIHSAMDLLTDEKSPSTEFLEMISKTVMKSVKRINNIINTLQQISATRSNSSDLEEINIIQPLKQSLIMLDDTIQAHKINVIFDNLPQEILSLASYPELSKLYFHLLKNSIEAIKDQQNKKIIISIAEVNNHIHMSFKDSGHIPLEIRNKIFLPFFSTQKESSSGLGLSSCKGIVEKLEGRIFLEDSTDQTEFKIILPLKRKSPLAKAS